MMDENSLEDASRIEEMIKDINKEMDDKKYMFEESSDDDYWLFFFYNLICLLSILSFSYLFFKVSPLLDLKILDWKLDIFLI